MRALNVQSLMWRPLLYTCVFCVSEQHAWALMRAFSPGIQNCNKEFVAGRVDEWIEQTGDSGDVSCGGGGWGEVEAVSLYC